MPKIGLYFIFILSLFFACKSNTDAPEPKETATGKPISFTSPEALFTDHLKVANGLASTVIMDRLISLIDAAPAESFIHIAIYGFEYPALVEAIKRADARGVKQAVMIDISREETIAQNPPTINALKASLKNGEVIPVESDASASAINHNKFALFSEITTTQGKAKNIIFQTSHNFTVADSKKIQDAVIMPHDGLYQAYKAYWEDMRAKATKGMKDFFYREYTDPAIGLTAYFFPKRRNGTAYGDDTIIEILNDITDPATATVRVGMSDWVVSRKNVLDKLDLLHSQGATVEIIAKSSVDAEILAGLESLRQKGAFVKIYNMTQSGQPKINIHAKFMMIKGKWRGEQANILVTGSHNFTTNALRNNNEAMLLFKNHAFFNTYETTYEKLKTLPGLVK